MTYDLNALLQAAHQKVEEQIERLGYFAGVGVSSDDGRIHLSLSPKQGRADASRRLAPMKMWKLDGKRIRFDNLKAAIAELQEDIMETKMYMNVETGNVDDYEGWWYEDADGHEVNAVDLGEVVEVVRNVSGEWEEV